MSQPVVVCLGRYGDILNALPIAYQLSKEGKRPKFVTTEEFWTILKGVSYVDLVVWNRDYKELPFAIERVKDNESYIVQSYMNPDSRRLTDSYQKESWRVAGWLDRFGTIPLVIDVRDPSREAGLDLKYALRTPNFHAKKKSILVAGKSVSSPTKFDLVKCVREAFMDHNVIDLCDTTAGFIHDLVGVMDKAQMLVSIDTMHLHLARASTIPVVSIINNGWFGSVPPPNSVATIRYADLTEQNVISAVAQNL